MGGPPNLEVGGPAPAALDLRLDLEAATEVGGPTTGPEPDTAGTDVGGDPPPLPGPALPDPLHPKTVTVTVWTGGKKMDDPEAHAVVAGPSAKLVGTAKLLHSPLGNPAALDTVVVATSPEGLATP